MELLKNLLRWHSLFTFESFVFSLLWYYSSVAFFCLMLSFNAWLPNSTTVWKQIQNRSLTSVNSFSAGLCTRLGCLSPDSLQMWTSGILETEITVLLCKGCIWVGKYKRISSSVLAGPQLWWVQSPESRTAEEWGERSSLLLFDTTVIISWV